MHDKTVSRLSFIWIFLNLHDKKNMGLKLIIFLRLFLFFSRGSIKRRVNIHLINAKKKDIDILWLNIIN